jgi:hypothetical protein
MPDGSVIMDKFTETELQLNKDVKKGDKESLLSLFSVKDRFKRMEVLKDVDEGQSVKVILKGLGETELLLGNDMEIGNQKTIMTLFWYSERSKPIEMTRDAKAGESITIEMLN